MMRYLLAVLSIASCAAAPQGINRVENKRGQVYWEYESTEGVPDGESRTYYPGGELRSIRHFENSDFHGPFVGYAPSGEVVVNAFYWHDVLVWTSNDANAEPPRELLARLRVLHDPETIRSLYGRSLIVQWRQSSDRDKRSPSPSFTHADWRLPSKALVGAHLALGGATSNAASGQRESVYGQLPWRQYSASFLYTQSRLRGNLETLSGRKTIELGAARNWALPAGRLTTRLATSLPVTREGASAALATAATTSQSPSSAVNSVASSVAVRSTATWQWQRDRVAVQTDLGLDYAIAEETMTLPLFLRSAAAVAYGIRSVYGTVELNTARRLDSQSSILGSIGMGAGVRVASVLAKVLVATSFSSDFSGSLGVEYAF